jgi:leucyl aminopeptidase
MRTFFLVVLFICIGFCLSEGGQRLLEVSEGKRIWVSEETFQKIISERKSRNVGFFDVTDFQKESTFVPKESPLPKQITKEYIVRPLLEKIKEENLESIIKKLQSYHNRYYTQQTGYEAAMWIFGEFKRIISMLPPARRDLFQVELFSHSFLQPSIICKMKGNSKKDEIIIVGAHEDSVTGGATAKAPGADDNASGVAGLLEIFRIIAESNFTSERSIEFHVFAAEEVGLYGSQAIASNYSNSKKQVHVFLNYDMIGWEPTTADKSFGIISDHTSPEASEFLYLCMAAYTRHSGKLTPCGYGCSDHASFSKYKYRSCYANEGYPTGNYNKKIHTQNDLLGELSMRRAAEHIKYGIGLIYLS